MLFQRGIGSNHWVHGRLKKKSLHCQTCCLTKLRIILKTLQTLLWCWSQSWGTANTSSENIAEHNTASRDTTRKAGVVTCYRGTTETLTAKGKQNILLWYQRSSNKWKGEEKVLYNKIIECIWNTECSINWVDILSWYVALLSRVWNKDKREGRVKTDRLQFTKILI